MNFLFPILSAILQAGSFTLDKVILSFRNINYKTYNTISFPLLFIITGIIFLIFHPSLSLKNFSGHQWLLVLALAIIGFIGSIILYRALDHNYLGEVQTIGLLQNIPLVVLPAIIFADERKIFVIIAALIASGAIIWSHWEKNKIKFGKYNLSYVAYSLLLVPLASLVTKQLLITWHPISLYLINAAILTLAFIPFLAKERDKISPKIFFFFVATNLLSVTAALFYYFSYQRSGIIYTTLLYSLKPLLVYFASLLILKESIHWKKIVAFGVVLASIIASKFIG